MKKLALCIFLLTLLPVQAEANNRTFLDKLANDAACDIVRLKEARAKLIRDGFLIHDRIVRPRGLGADAINKMNVYLKSLHLDPKTFFPLGQAAPLSHLHIQLALTKAIGFPLIMHINPKRDYGIAAGVKVRLDTGNKYTRYYDYQRARYISVFMTISVSW